MNTTKVNLTALLFIFCLATIKAQVSKPDSIDKILNHLKGDTSKVNLLIETGNAQLDILPDKAFDYCQQAIVLSKKN